MVNYFDVTAYIVDLFIVTPDYQLVNNSGVTEILKNYNNTRNQIANSYITIVPLNLHFLTSEPSNKNYVKIICAPADFS